MNWQAAVCHSLNFAIRSAPFSGGDFCHPSNSAAQMSARSASCSANDAASRSSRTILLRRVVAQSSRRCRGSHTISIAGSGQTLVASAIGSLEAFGSPEVGLWVEASSAASGEAFGDPELARQARADSVATGEAFGMALVSLPQTLIVGGIASVESFGLPVFFTPSIVAGFVVVMMADARLQGTVLQDASVSARVMEDGRITIRLRDDADVDGTTMSDAKITGRIV